MPPLAGLSCFFPVLDEEHAGRGEDAAVAQRARAKLGGAVDPADDAALRDLVSHQCEERRVALELFARKPILGGQPGQLRGICFRAPIGMVGEFDVRPLEMNAIGVERGAQRAAGVAWRGGNEHALESCFPQDARVGAAVERHAAAQAEIGQPRLGVQRARQVDHRLFEDELHAGGDIGGPLAVVGFQIDRVVGIARRTEGVDELGGVGALRAGVELEPIEVEGKGAIRGAP